MITRRNFLRRASGLLVPVTFMPSLLLARKSEAASTIVSRTISSVVDQRISLANSNFSRLHGVASSWNVLRIGIRYSFNATATILGNPKFAFGLCHGSTNIFLDATTDHFLGETITSATLTYTANAGFPYLGSPSSDQINLCQKQNSGSLTTAGSVTTSWYLGADPTTARRSMFFVEFTKGSPWSVKMFYRSAFNSTDVLQSDFNTQMAVTSAGSCSFTDHAYTTAMTATVNEGTYGTLDSVCAAWNQSLTTVEICDLAVTKIS